MNLRDYAAALNKHLKVEKVSGRIQVRIDGAEVIYPGREGLLTGALGIGATERHAKLDYIRQISGYTIVFNAWLPNRQEFQVPASLRP